MFDRRVLSTILDRLEYAPAVALLGPRQVGKTTLARRIAANRPSIYLDLELPADRERIADPELFVQTHREVLVVLDEIHRLPEVFSVLRSIIDRGGRPGQFLILGSASIELLRQTSESLAGRIAFVEMAPLDAGEVAAGDVDLLWTRGGFPRSFLASNERESLNWRRDFIRTYLERDVAQFGSRVPAETLRRFWTMLAHSQSSILNAAQLARGLAVDGKSVTHYLDLMVDLLLVRRLPPYYVNIRKRLVKSPRIYVRDSGILHSLLDIADQYALLGHPVIGASWEGFVTEQLLAAAGTHARGSFYRTAGGAEIDLIIEGLGHGPWAIEIKRSLAPKVEKGFHAACADIQPARAFVVYPGQDRFPVGHGVEAVGLADLMAELSSAA